MNTEDLELALKWHVETRLLKDLKPHPKNPRRLSKNEAVKLEESLDEFGQAQPIIINLDNTIIGGHQRYNLFKKKKIKEINCSIPERLLTEKEAEKLCIKLNLHYGEWDENIIANEWDLPELMTYGLTLDDLDLEESDGAPPPPKEGEKCPTCGKKMKVKQ